MYPKSTLFRDTCKGFATNIPIYFFQRLMPIQPPAINRIFHYFLQPISPSEIVKLYQPIHVISALAFLTQNYVITQKNIP